MQSLLMIHEGQATISAADQQSGGNMSWLLPLKPWQSSNKWTIVWSWEWREPIYIHIHMYVIYIYNYVYIHMFFDVRESLKNNWPKTLLKFLLNRQAIGMAGHRRHQQPLPWDPWDPRGGIPWGHGSITNLRVRYPWLIMDDNKMIIWS